MIRYLYRRCTQTHGALESGLKLFLGKSIFSNKIWHRVHNQCCGSGAARIRNFLLYPDPELEVMYQDPELDLNFNKNYEKFVPVIDN
jgi:hypothetical protein